MKKGPLEQLVMSFPEPLTLEDQILHMQQTCKLVPASLMHKAILQSLKELQKIKKSKK